MADAPYGAIGSMIFKGEELEGDLHLVAEVCVIGSGAGGAVIAKELAEAGHDVVVVEQGGYYTKEDFTQREDEMMPLLYEDMGQRATVDQSVLILQGRNVGGSTVHNLCYCFRTPEPILRKWAREDGILDMSYERMVPSFERVEKMLKVKDILPHEINTLNRKIQEGCEKLGYHGVISKHNRENCTTSGFCLLGCPFDAKQSMLITYVPAASAAGARIYANCAARRLYASGDRVVSLEGEVLDALHRPRHAFRVQARVFVLSAGAINSPRLLLNSGIANGSGQVGRNLHLHPSVMLAGIYDEDIHGYRGIPQSYLCDEFLDLEKDPDSGYLLMPVYGFPVTTATQLPGFGREHSEWMRSFHRMAGLLVLLHDESAGRVEVDGSGRPLITYALNAKDERLCLEGMRHCAEVLFASGAKKVIVPYEDPLILSPGDDLSAIDQRGLRPNEIQLASTHPQSTTKMGEDPTRSVVNSWCRSHELGNLFVCDMGVFPSSLGAPPQITTAAIADRTARYIHAQWSSGF